MTKANLDVPKVLKVDSFPIIKDTIVEYDEGIDLEGNYNLKVMSLVDLLMKVSKVKLVGSELAKTIMEYIEQGDKSYWKYDVYNTVDQNEAENYNEVDDIEADTASDFEKDLFNNMTNEFDD
jgi:hypothetical protein